MTDRVLIIDFGSQVTQLIARRVRESGVYCEVVPVQKAEEALAAAREQAKATQISASSYRNRIVPEWEKVQKHMYDAIELAGRLEFARSVPRLSRLGDRRRGCS